MAMVRAAGGDAGVVLVIRCREEAWARRQRAPAAAAGRGRDPGREVCGIAGEEEEDVDTKRRDDEMTLEKTMGGVGKRQNEARR